MKSIIIPFHSFSGLITNSSSETFVAATNSTVAAMKSMLCAFMAAHKDGRPVDEVFSVELVTPFTVYYNLNDDFKEICPYCSFKSRDGVIQEIHAEFADQDLSNVEVHCPDGKENSHIMITSKDPDYKHFAEIASSLQKTFAGREYYC